MPSRQARTLDSGVDGNLQRIRVGKQFSSLRVLTKTPIGRHPVALLGTESLLGGAAAVLGRSGRGARAGFHDPPMIAALQLLTREASLLAVLAIKFRIECALDHLSE